MRDTCKIYFSTHTRAPTTDQSTKHCGTRGPNWHSTAVHTTRPQPYLKYTLNRIPHPSRSKRSNHLHTCDPRKKHKWQMPHNADGVYKRHRQRRTRAYSHSLPKTGAHERPSPMRAHDWPYASAVHLPPANNQRPWTSPEGATTTNNSCTNVLNKTNLHFIMCYLF